MENKLATAIPFYLKLHAKNKLDVFFPFQSTYRRIKPIYPLQPLVKLLLLSPENIPFFSLNFVHFFVVVHFHYFDAFVSIVFSIVIFFLSSTFRSFFVSIIFVHIVVGQWNKTNFTTFSYPVYFFAV